MNAPKLPVRAEAGVVIGGYELVRRIGRGGMAEVWVARRALGRKGTKFVAIKLIADHYVGDERYARMFRSEAELAAILSHTNIVQVFDEGEDNGRSYLIMEWVDGLNLLKLGAVLALLDDDDRRFRVTSYIIGQLLYALGYAHSITAYDGSPLGVVHRDVSPQNVLVSNHGEVKLTDFGVAYYTMEESSGIHVKGKVRYMAPEQLGGQTRSPTVDLFAVGALLHELLDGRKFREEYEDGQEMFTAVLSGTIPPLSRRAPPQLDELRLRLLAADPADRIQTAEEAVEWLKRYPGYGDARGELTKLCGSLTGVVRPRAGPGQSSQVPMADQRTGQFRGRKLAKPKVSQPSAALPAAPPRPSAASIRTTVPLRKDKGSQPNSNPKAVITGDTQFVAPQVLPAAPSRSSGPSRSARAKSGPAPSMTTAPRPPLHSPSPPPIAVAPAPSSPIPTYTPAQSSNPIVTYTPTQSSNPIPAYIPEQSSNPIGVAAPSESSGPGGGVGPIFVGEGSSAQVQPTERLPTSESSGPSSASGGTEIIDARSLMSDGAQRSGTDQDIAPVLVRGDGTDTSREIAHRATTRSQTTISIALPQRSAIAFIVIGLLIIAGLSVALTWYLVARNRGAAATDVAAVEDRADKDKDPRTEMAAVDDSRDAAEPEAPPTEAVPTAVPDGAPIIPEPPVDLDDAPPEPEPEPEDSADEAAVPTPDEPDDANVELDPTQQLDTESEPAPAKPEPVAKSKVIIRSVPGTKSYELKIGGRRVKGGMGIKTVRLTPGRKKVRWRSSPSGPWKNAEDLDLQAGRSSTLLFTTVGPRELKT